MTDLVNHPPHYTSNPFGLETIEITRHYNFDVGNALKYILRAGRKGLGDWAGKELMPVDEAQAKITDLRKAVWYLLDEIESTRAQFAGIDLDDPYGTNQPDRDEDSSDDMVEGEAEAIASFLRDNPGLAGLAFSEAVVELPDVAEEHARVLREGRRIPRHSAEES